MSGHHDRHISDQELIQAADGEVSRHRSTAVQAHLEACWTCRSRRAELEQAVAEFVHATNGSEDADLPPVNGPRALLRARLAEAARSSPVTPWDGLRQLVFSHRLPVYGSFALILAAAFTLAVHLSVRNVNASWIPDARLTPGATRPVTTDHVCSVRTTEGFYPIPATLAYRVFEKYKIRNPMPRTYEVDYLITPALGGADDIRNLWPQPYAGGEWNAHIKDALEEYLRNRVCQGQLDLATAQRDISANWIAAYQKYFDTERPLEVHAAFSIDAPWED
jgi:anti-sigma factor RsiW